MLPAPRRQYLRCDTLISCTPAGNPDSGAASANAPPTPPIENAAILIQDDRIVAAGPASEVPMPPDAAVVDYSGCAILPGLIDAHVHLMYRAGETIYAHARDFDDHQLLVRSAYHARLLVEAGVTTVRDCGSRGTFLPALRDGIATGLLPGPRLLVAGPPITTTAGHLWVCGGEVDSVEQARALVRRLVKERVDFVKVMATGGRMTPGSNVGRAQFSVAELTAIVEDAHRLQRRVAAHALGTEGIARAAEAGVDTVEHCIWLDESGRGHRFDEAVARQMAERGIYCNLASQPNRELAEKPLDQPLGAAERRQLDPYLERWHWFRRGLELGVPSFFSTDSIYGLWEADCRNLTWLAGLIVERGGIAALDALRMITAVAARAIGLGDEVGAIAPGKVADLLVVRGNPAHHIRDLHHVRAVYQAGRRTFAADG